MTYVIVPLDERAKQVVLAPHEVDYDEYIHFLNVYHGEFCYIRFDFFEGGVVYFDSFGEDF